MEDTFRERERGEEARFKLSEELRFKARCRRNKLAALWAAERLGLERGEADDYVRTLIALALEHPGADALAARIAADFERAGARTAADEIAAVVERCHGEALASLVDAFPTALDTDHIQVGG